ncbi:MAG: hypothetical protein ACI92E_002759 [Oceanicoccus sp.]|jgi:uncharacterized protein (TIGR02466 family)
MAKNKAARKKLAVKVEAAETPQPGNNMAMAFGTPLMTFQWPDIDTHNAALANLILAKEKADTGITRSNAGGWHSQTDLMTWDDPAIRILQGRIEKMTGAMTRGVTVADKSTSLFNFKVDSWANINRHGGYNRVHNHPNAMWSGVYYVSPGDPDDSWPENGKLEMVDPRAGINMMYQDGTVMAARYMIDPVPGLMIMFPSWLQHFVHPFYGQGERISIAFNIVADEIKGGANRQS